MAHVLKSAVKNPNSVPSSVATDLKLAFASDSASEVSLTNRLQKQAVTTSIYSSSDVSNQAWNSGLDRSNRQQKSEH